MIRATSYLAKMPLNVLMTSAAIALGMLIAVRTVHATPIGDPVVLGARVQNVQSMAASTILLEARPTINLTMAADITAAAMVEEATAAGMATVVTAMVVALVVVVAVADIAGLVGTEAAVTAS